MKFHSYTRLRRAALTAGVLVPVAALGAILVPADANVTKVKQPGKVQASWSGSTKGVTTKQYRTVWSATAQGRNLPMSYHGAVVIQRLSHKGWKSGMMLTPAGARDLATQILKQIQSSSGSVQIYNHQGGRLHATDMLFNARAAYALANDLLASATGH